MEVRIRTNGLESANVVAEFRARTQGGKGGRTVELYGADKSEMGAREQLLEQAKAARDELNRTIEDMIGELINATPGTASMTSSRPIDVEDVKSWLANKDH
jgi:hypothetical protein